MVIRYVISVFAAASCWESASCFQKFVLEELSLKGGSNSGVCRYGKIAVVFTILSMSTWGMTILLKVYKVEY